MASVGIGHHLTTAGNAAYYQQTGCTTQLNPSSVVQQDITLPPVNQGDAATHNDNVRITNAVATQRPDAEGSDQRQDERRHAGTPRTRQLAIDHNSSLTLTGQTYSFCKLTLSSNSALYIAAGQTVNIYFDSPEHCDVPPGTLPVDDSTAPRARHDPDEPLEQHPDHVGYGDPREGRDLLRRLTVAPHEPADEQ